MSGHVELRNNANAAVPRIGDQVAHFVLRVVEAVRAHLLQLGKFLALDPEALVLREVPVKYVQLHRCHAIEITLQDVERNEVTAHIDHQSAPGKAWLVLDRNCGHGKAVGSGLHQLQKCLQAAHDSERRRCIELRAPGADLKRVGFILAEFLHFLTCTFAVNHQLGLSRIRHLHVQRRHASLASKVIQEEFNRTPQMHIRVAADSHRE